MIEVGTTPTGDAPVCCYVRDNGAGFDIAYASKLFQPFQRPHDPREFPGIAWAWPPSGSSWNSGRAWAEGNQVRAPPSTSPSTPTKPAG
ncbi:MAG: hypothetical protein ACLPKI_16590 [Streptosporangiaceae bacterium]